MDDFKIVKVRARELISDYWLPNLEVDILTKGGVLGRGASPSGTRPLENEAVYLRDGGRRYGGYGVLKAIRNINEVIAPKIIGMDVTEQKEIDELMIELDGTINKSNLGGNATLSVSLAVADAAAKSLRIPAYRYLGGREASTLPVPWVWLQAVEATGRRRTLSFQEHHVVPLGAESFTEALRMSAEVHFAATRIMGDKYGKPVVLGETTYYPAIIDEFEALDRAMEAIEEVGYDDVFALALDCAATHMYVPKRETYLISGKELNREDMISFYKELTECYPIFALEDPLHQNDFQGHAQLTREIDIQIVGDDLFVTNIKRLTKGIEMGAANALLLKPNQIGTLTEALTVGQYAQKKGYNVVVSGRQGIDEEDLIPDIAVAINAGQTKLGPLPSRRAKYNRLLRIEEELGERARYLGRNLLHPSKHR